MISDKIYSFQYPISRYSDSVDLMKPPLLPRKTDTAFPRHPVSL